jgi:hypothetical protein
MCVVWQAGRREAIRVRARVSLQQMVEARELTVVCKTGPHNNVSVR